MSRPLRLSGPFTGHRSKQPKMWASGAPPSEGPPLQFHNIWTEQVLNFANEETHSFNNPDVKTIAIIGAGPAGLTAAYELQKFKEVEKIHIFESSDRVGGRVLTVGQIGGFSEETTPWVNDSLESPVIGEAGAMRLPLIPDALVKGRWDMSSLSDQQVNDLIHGKEVNGYTADVRDFPMPLTRHYIKELEIPVRRFNMNPSIAQVDVCFANNAEKQFTGTFVLQDGILTGTEGEYRGKTLDDSVIEFLFEKGDKAVKIWMKLNGVKTGQNGKNLHDMFEQDVTAPAISTITNGRYSSEPDYLHLIDLESWNSFLAEWNDVTYEDQLGKKGWPPTVIEFYGNVYRTDMAGSKVGVQIIEDEIGHWWQPNMFTATYGMHSLYDAPKGKNFKGFRQALDASGIVDIKFNQHVICIARKEKGDKRSNVVITEEGVCGEYDVVLVTIPPPQLQNIKYIGYGEYAPDQDSLFGPDSNSPIPMLSLAKKLFQFDEAFWMKSTNNKSGFVVDYHNGFAVISNNEKNGHLSQFRYSNPDYEQNVILNYEFGDNATFAAHDDNQDILNTIQDKFHTNSARVSKHAYLNDWNVRKSGFYSKPYLGLFDSATSKAWINAKQKYCNANPHLLYFAGDFWSFAPQWQEGAMYTALHAVYRMILRDESDPFNYQ